jgi:hypothetical protein
MAQGGFGRPFYAHCQGRGDPSEFGLSIFRNKENSLQVDSCESTRI